MPEVGDASPWGPTIVEGLEQRTDEWLSFRRTGPATNPFDAAVGASQAHDFLRASALQRLMMIRGRIEAPTAAMIAGQRMEPVLRAEYEERTGRVGAPSVCYPAAAPWVVASLDWLAEDGRTLVEIKYMGERRFEALVGGRIPPEIYTQVQLQLAASGAEVAHVYAGLRDTSVRHLEVIAPDTVYQRAVLIRLAWALRSTYDHPSSSDVERLLERLNVGTIETGGDE